MLSVLFLEDLGLMFDAASSAASALMRPRAAAAALMERAGLSVFQGPDAVEQAAEDWQALENEAGAATPFQTLALARAAAQAHVQRGETPRIVVVRQAGRPVVILPTALSKQFGVTVARFLGDPLIQYGDALCEPGTPKRQIEAAFHAAADPAVVDAIHFRKVRHDARIAAVLRVEATASHRDEAPFLDLSHPCDKDELRKVKRARRKLESLGALRLDVTQDEAARGHLRDALALKRRWLKARRLPSSVVGDDHWERAIERLLDHDKGLRVCVLHAGDRQAAYEIALTAGDRWYAFMGAVAEDFARHSPGHVQVADTIAWCRANGYVRYDVLAPADDVKRSYCNNAAEVADYSRALRPGGYLFASALRLLPAAKAAFIRLPAPLRKPILRWAGR